MDIRQAIKLATLGSAGIAIVACSNGGDELTSALEGAQYVSIEVSVDSENQVFGVGTFEFLTATATLADGSTEDVTNRVQWSVSDSTLATVASPANGEAFARLTANSGSETGDVTATASFNLAGLDGSVTLEVSDAALLDLTLSVENSADFDADLMDGEVHECSGPYILIATAEYDGANDIRTITHLVNDESGWSLVDGTPDVVSLDPSLGEFSTLGIDSSGNQTVQIQAEFGSESAAGAFEVLDRLQSIVIDEEEPFTIQVGRTGSFTARGTYSATYNSVLADGLQWTDLGTPDSGALSLNNELTTGSTGVFNAESVGNENITVTCGNTISAAFNVEVNPEPSAIRVASNREEEDVTFELEGSSSNNEHQLDAFFFYPDDTELSTDRVSNNDLDWTLVLDSDGSSTSGASIDDDGLVTVREVGTYRVTARYNDGEFSDTFVFRVVDDI